MSQNINQKLFGIQQKLIAPKNQYNSFGKYNYRSLEDIMIAVKPLLAEYKCVLNFEDDVVSENPIILKCTATILCTESADFRRVSSIVGVDPNKKGMDVAQSFGASSSYGRKYAANGLFLIDDTKDADATNKHGKEDDKPLLDSSNPDYKKAVDYIAKGGSIEDIKKKYRLSASVEQSLIK